MSYSLPTILPTLVIYATVVIFAYLGWAVVTHH